MFCDACVTRKHFVRWTCTSVFGAPAAAAASNYSSISFDHETIMNQWKCLSAHHAKIVRRKSLTQSGTGWDHFENWSTQHEYEMRWTKNLIKIVRAFFEDSMWRRNTNTNAQHRTLCRWQVNKSRFLGIFYNKENKHSHCPNTSLFLFFKKKNSIGD